MQTITTIGLDIAKSVFQVHGVDVGGQVIVRRQLKRRHVLTLAANPGRPQFGRYRRKSGRRSGHPFRQRLTPS
jgi:hypothetical protein